MFNMRKLIKEVENSGSVFYGYVSGGRDLDSILHRILMMSSKNDIVCFCKPSDFVDIKSALETIDILYFVEYIPNDIENNVLPNFSFARLGVTVDIFIDPNIKNTLFFPDSEDIQPKECLIIKRS